MEWQSLKGLKEWPEGKIVLARIDGQLFDVQLKAEDTEAGPVTARRVLFTHFMVLTKPEIEE